LHGERGYKGGGGTAPNRGLMYLAQPLFFIEIEKCHLQYTGKYFIYIITRQYETYWTERERIESAAHKKVDEGCARGVRAHAAAQAARVPPTCHPRPPSYRRTRVDSLNSPYERHKLT
jgi:hypothetical protein